jgi:hypothetical protein
LTAFNDSVSQGQQQNIFADDLVDFLNVLCSRFEVEIQVKIFNERCEWVTVLNDISFDDFSQLVKVKGVVTVLVEILVHDGSDTNVSEEMRAQKLND